ncbi:MAG: FkbM family methyltransferase [Rhizobiaceae bacterium]
MAGAKAELDTESELGSRRANFWQRLIWQICDWHPLPQKWRQKLRKKYARKVVGPFDIVHQRMRFRLYPAENYCDRVLFGRNQLPEQEEHEALQSVLRPGAVFVDIGANVGTYSIFVSTKLQGDCTILAMEPHPRTFQKLIFNLRANNISTQTVHNVGVGPSRGTIDLWSDGGSNIGHTSMVKEGTSNPKIRHEVQIVPLLDLLKENSLSRIDVLKIDIEGFEDQALAPFFDSADEALWPKHVLIEIAHQALWQRDLMAMLNERGYTESFRTNENRLMSRQ